MTARKLAEREAAQGSKEAYTLLGEIYQERGSASRRTTRRRPTPTAKGAELGDANAQFSLGTLLSRGPGREEGPQCCRQPFREGCQKRPCHGPIQPCPHLSRRQGTPHGRDEGVRMDAEGGRAEPARGAIRSWRLLSIRARRNQWIEVKAAEWTGKAAEAGVPEAQAEYGVMLFKGEGVAVDEQRAAKMFRLSAEQGQSGGPEPACPPLRQWRRGRTSRSGPGRQMASSRPRGGASPISPRHPALPSSRPSSAPPPTRQPRIERDGHLSE